jgi:hypothetical protein
MKLKLILLLFILNLISSKAQQQRNLSGTYAFGKDIEVTDVGEVLIVQKTPDSLLIYISVSKAAPSYSTTTLLTKLFIKNNTSCYNSEESTECALVFNFEEDKIKIIQNSPNFTFGAAHLNRTFFKKDNSEPKYFYLGNGEKVQLTEDAPDFSENLHKQKGVFDWGVGLCDYTGFFNDSEFTIEQLEKAELLSDKYGAERQHEFSLRRNIRKNDTKDNNIKGLELLEYSKLKKDYLKLRLNENSNKNTKKWNAFLAENVASIDKQLSVQITILKSSGNPKYLLDSEHYSMIKVAAVVLNSSDKEIKKYFFKEFREEDKMTSIENMKEFIFEVKVVNALYDSFKSRYEIFTGLFDRITENCTDGPY